MGYVAIFSGLLLLFGGLTGKVLPPRRLSLAETPPGLNRAVYVWLGLLFSAFGLFLLIHRRNG